MKRNSIILSFIFFLSFAFSGFGSVPPFSTGSVYTERPRDNGAVFFEPSRWGLSSDGKSDVSAALQQTIDDLKREKNFGIVFIPEGTYRIGRTIYIPASIRLIGYGRTRPVFYLAPSTPAFQRERTYMFWFTDRIVEEGSQPSDAGAGTFYSAISNIDFRIDKGNPSAVAIRAHFAQHSFISHCDFTLVDALAGIYDAGNELEDLRFFGGQHGIISGRASPGWPIMMTDCYFKGQSVSAVSTREAGLAIVNMHVDSVPVAIDMEDGQFDRLFIENSLFENISDAAIKLAVTDNTYSQINLKGIECSSVAVLVHNKMTSGQVRVDEKAYLVRDYAYGLVYDSLGGKPEMKEICGILPRAYNPNSRISRQKDIPSLPRMESWLNIMDYGAVGDGKTDDTRAFEAALSEGRPIYVPTGWYRITKPLKMEDGSSLIGLHPYATQLILSESEPAFSGFGPAQPLLSSSVGGADILSGIGISTGAYNYRAVGVKWMAGERSYLNDVKFVGGHGTLRNPLMESSSTSFAWYQGPRVSSPSSPVYEQGKDLAWDNQYWSLWITDGGGGTIKDVWSADTYAGAGLYISDTSTPGRIYAMSLEHHVRTEAILRNVKNWKIYALQFEEEGREGPACYNMDMAGCENISMANVWMYRVIRAKTPKDIGIRLWGGRDLVFMNMHNYTQVLPVIDYPIYEMSKGIPVTSWDFARLTVSGDEKTRRETYFERHVPKMIASGFDFATGAVCDSRGNVYFAENSSHKIYRWNSGDGSVSFLLDSPWKPFSLAVDTRDDVVAVFRYDPQPGYMVDGRQESVDILPDDNPWYSGWGNGGWRAMCYSFSPDDPDDIKPLRRARVATLKTLQRIYVPASRWRTDYDTIVEAMPEYCWVAPDGWTILPDTYDLGRNTSLVSYAPSQLEPVYVVNENNKTTISYEALSDGRLRKKEQVAPFGQYSTVRDSKGNLYVADGDIYIYDEDGEEAGIIPMPERPLSISLAGKDGNMILITTTSSIYLVRI